MTDILGPEAESPPSADRMMAADPASGEASV
jgi:hypothetical protein